MNLGDLTDLVEKPFAAVSNLVNTPNSAGRYRPFYLRNLLDVVQGRTLHDAVGGTITLITGGSSGIGEAEANKIAEAEIINVSSVGVQTRAPRFGAYIASSPRWTASAMHCRPRW
jgi:hypothetical protein